MRVVRSSPRSASSLGFSLLEIMVAVTLLTFIIGGLTLMFSGVKRAVSRGNTQNEVLESSRAAMGLLAQTLQQLAPSQQSNRVSFLSRQFRNSIPLVLPGGDTKTLVLQDTYVLSRVGDEWQTTKFAFDPNEAASGVGTLFVKLARTNVLDLDFIANPAAALETVADDPNAYRRLIEGVVHLELIPFDQDGVEMRNPFYGYDIVNESTGPYVGHYAFSDTAMPAAIEIELGLLEDKTLAQLRVVAGPNLQNRAAVEQFLTDNAGSIHLFRQRIPVYAENRLVP